jgi:hypothetical protein
MELAEFKQAVKEAAALLNGMKKLNLKCVDQALIDYLNRLEDDPVGLEVLRNSIAFKV